MRVPLVQPSMSYYCGPASLVVDIVMEVVDSCESFQSTDRMHCAFKIQ